MGKQDAHNTPPPPAPKRKRAPRRKPPLTAQQRAWKILQNIRALAESRQDSLGHHRGPSDREEDLVLRIRIPLEKRVTKDRYDTLTAELLEALETGQKRQRRPKASPLEPELGTIHCFQCAGPCNHRVPPSNDSVFAGYTATGKPVWLSLTNALLNGGDPRVGRLHGKGRSVLAHRWCGSQIGKELLPGFGKDEQQYKLRGQVAVGYLTLAHQSDSKRVLAVQIVEGLQQSGRRMLFFNLTGTTLPELADSGTGKRSATAGLYLKTREFQTRVEKLSRRWGDAQKRNETFDVQGACDRLTSQFKTEVERAFRTEKRRTMHGSDRHSSGERPTSHAFRDLQNSDGESVYRDTTTGAVVVVGRKGRVHIFSGTGKLVTSVHLGKQDVERRLVDGRWNPLDRTTFATWRETVRPEDVRNSDHERG